MCGPVSHGPFPHASPLCPPAGSNFKAFRRKGGSSTSVDASSGLLAPPAIVPLDPEPYQEAKIDTEAFLK